MAVTMADGACSSGIAFWGFSVLVRPMGDELGWSRAELFGALTVRSLVTGALAPFMGPLQDSRNGPRLLALATAVTMSGSMLAMKWIDDLILFYVLFAGLGALASFGSSEMLMTAVLPRWFVRQRGRALGIASMGTAMGPLMFPFIVTGLLSLLYWRDAWLALGLVTLAVLGPLALLVRTRPEDMGETPDGDSNPEKTSYAPLVADVTVSNAESTSSPPSPSPSTLRLTSGQAPRGKGERLERDFTRSQVLRLPTFWLLVISFSLTTVGTGGFHANWLSYFQDIGFSPAEGSMAATAYGICSISTRVFWGWLAERFAVRYMLALQGALTALSVLLFLNIHDQATLILAAASNGLAMGGIFVMRPMSVASYFGRGHLGAVNGVLRPFVTIASAVSPLLVAWLYDLQGSYETVFWVIAACWFGAAAAVVFARTPQGREAAALRAGSRS